MLEMNFKKKFTPFAYKHSNADPTRGQQRAARSQQSCRRRESWGNRGEEKKACTRFGACTPTLLHIHVSSHQTQLAPIASPFPLRTNPGFFHPRAPSPCCLLLSSMAGSSSDWGCMASWAAGRGWPTQSKGLSKSPTSCISPNTTPVAAPAE